MTIYRILFFLLITFQFSFGQSTFFIKYKNEVNLSTIQEKVRTKQIFKLLKAVSTNYETSFLSLNDEDANLNRIIKVEFSDDQDLNSIFSILRNDPEIDYLQKNTIYKVNYIPTDSLLNQQWGLKKINAFQAWDISRGNENVLLAVIDTGIDFLHPELQNKIKVNSNETGVDALGNDKKTNNIDDDNNGFIDDYMGWDFVDRTGFPFDTISGDYLSWDNTPMDEHFHGTFVAGIAGAESNNGKGISGVAPNIKILNLRAFDASGNGEEDDVASAILYAVKMGAKVINMSFGDVSFSYVLRDVIKYAYSKGVVLVASSGNSNTNEPHYPSGFTEVISVGNSTQEDYTVGSFGSTLDLVAPGTSILSLAIGGGYRTESGTSASAPFVSASAALVLSLGNFSNDEVKQILKSSADDIGTTGWDQRTGAGRLNLFKALTILSPSIIKISSPTQDFSTNQDSLLIKATVLSPYFTGFNLYIGKGINPTSWSPLIQNYKTQINNETIYTLNLKELQDTSYTLRLTVNQSTGFTTEERVNIHILRNAPQIVLANYGSILKGTSSTLFAEGYTSQKSIVRMFYKEKNSNNFNFITLDGFSTNTQFVRQYHYGFIPNNLINQNTEYDVYFEAENLAGLKSLLLDPKTNSYFTLKTESVPVFENINELAYSLPKGTLFNQTIKSLDNSDNILFNTFYPSADIYYSIFRFENNSFVKQQVDSIKNKIPRFLMNVNNDSTLELISNYTRTGYIDELSNSDFKLKNFYTDSSQKFYPIFQYSTNTSNKFIITNDNDDRYLIWGFGNGSNTPMIIDTLENFSSDSTEFELDYYNKILNNVGKGDFNGDGIQELVFNDMDGDVISYNIDTQGKITKQTFLSTNLLSKENNCLAVGKYDNDDIDDIAILMSTNVIAPAKILLIFNFKNGEFNLLAEKLFLDQSAEFSGFTFGKNYRSLKFSNINNEGKDELIVNVFPYTYIYKYNNNQNQLIWFKEGTNNENILVNDFNKNGIPEFSMQQSDGYSFYEYNNTNTVPIPVYLKSYSISSNKVYMSWEGISEKYYIYRGIDRQYLLLVDSTLSKNYIDSNVVDLTTYFYAVKGSSGINISGFSEIKEVYTHTPAKVVSVESRSTNTLLVTFSGEMKSVIENLRTMFIENYGYPNSITPESQKSYLLTYSLPFSAATYKLIINGLVDAYDTPVLSDTISFVVPETPLITQLFVESFEIINPFRIKIIFNLPVNIESVLDKNNYAFNPENSVEKVEYDPSNHKIIYLNLERKKPIGSIGREYTLKINNVVSVDNTLISEGAGSYLVLTGFANNLSDVYVYPNPYKLDKGHEKITFANITKKVKVEIFTLSGEHVISLEEKDGNGGIDFNLIDKYGQKIASGIYIYKIIALDDFNKETEDKIGKFVIIQ